VARQSLYVANDPAQARTSSRALPLKIPENFAVLKIEQKNNTVTVVQPAIFSEAKLIGRENLEMQYLSQLPPSRELKSLELPVVLLAKRYWNVDCSGIGERKLSEGRWHKWQKNMKRNIRISARSAARNLTRRNNSKII
jgi:hypothetical protein